MSIQHLCVDAACGYKNKLEHVVFKFFNSSIFLAEKSEMMRVIKG